MASDLIDRKALVEACLNWLNRFNTDAFEFATCFPYWIFHNAIKEAPAVDAVEVVRCVDCERGEPSLIRKGEILCDWWRCHTRCDGFCHMGVEKDETD